MKIQKNNLILAGLAVILAAGLYLRIRETPDPTGAITPLPATVTAVDSLSVEQMKGDLDFLVNTLGEVHPRLIHGWIEAEQQIIQGAYDQLDGPKTAGEFYFIADEIVTLLHDGHTSLGTQGLGKMLDLPLFWTKEGPVVTDMRGELRTGDRLKSIGEMTPDEMLKALVKLIPAENEVWVKERGAMYIVSEFFLSHYGLLDHDQATVIVERDHKEIKVQLPLVEKVSPSYNPFLRQPQPFSYRVEEDSSLGIFELNDCTVSQGYLSALKNFFEEAHTKGIRNIAVDLRNNYGGDSRVIEYFMNYMDVDSYKSFGSFIRYSNQAAAQNGYSKKSGSDRYPPNVISNKHLTTTPFKGRLYVLTSPRTFSSANWFALIVQDNKLGKVIGQASGNQPSSYGDIINSQLPASGIPFSMSHKQFVRPDSSRDPATYIQPDISAYTTAQDIIDRRDAQLEKLREVVEANEIGQ
jgi:hypothetical protein